MDKIIESLDEDIAQLIRDKNLLIAIPIGVRLLVRTSIQTFKRYVRVPLPPGRERASSSWTCEVNDIDTIVTITVINHYSFQCMLWGQEKSSIQTRKYERDPTSISRITIKFSDVKTWKLWTLDDAPLTINYEYLTRTYKKLAFGR
jgi:hypothetical protein